MESFFKYSALCAFMAFGMLPQANAASDAVQLGYCGDEMTSTFGVNLTAELPVAIYLPAGMLQSYEGNQIERISIGLADDATDVSVFVTENLDGAPLREQAAGDLPSGWHDIVLDSPVDITGTGLYVGFTSTGLKHIGFSDFHDSPNGVWVRMFYEGQGGDVLYQWENRDEQFDGSLSIRAYVAGESMPAAEMSLESLDNVYVETDGTGVLTGVARNNTLAAVSSYEISYRLNNGEPVKETVEAEVACNALDTFRIELPANTQAVGEYPLQAEITAVNGQPDAAAWNNAAEAQYSVREYYFPRKVVVEEGTGTWCQWCPAGIVAFREMEKAYPDNFIGIAVHSQDVMAITTYQDLMNMFQGLPSCAVNRMEAITSPTFALVEHAYKQMAAPAQVGVKVTAEIATEGVIDVNAETTFGFDKEDASYRLCYVLVENEVRGTGVDYAQSNAYSGGTSGEMGGFEDLPNPIPADQMVYDHVARGIYQSFTGVLRSIPSTLVKGVANPHSYKIRMPGTVSKTENLELVALVLDMETGEILNAEKTKVVDTVSGIRETAADASLRLHADGGRIVADGECNALEVYTLQGVAVANDGLARGMYIVRAATPDGTVSRKVLVN